MKCPSCDTQNRPGAPRCKRCDVALPRSCAGCGQPLLDVVTGTLCQSCRTERVPAALGAEIQDVDLEEIAEEGPPVFSITPRFVGHKPLIERLQKRLEDVQE